MRKITTCLILTLLLGGFMSCKQDDSPVLSSCIEGSSPIYEYAIDGLDVQVYSNGEAYILDEGVCTFGAQFFTPGFFEDAYVVNENGIFFEIDGMLFEPYKNFEKDFEDTDKNLDIIIRDVSQIDRIFTNFTMQSPSAKTVNEYVQLQNCILDQTCDFVDNRFDLVSDPIDQNNKVLKFYSEAPSSDMVTAKSSIVSTLLLFQKGDDFWFEGEFYVDGDYPHTIADFESSYFEGSLGPRIFFKNGILGVENKFGSKLKFQQSSGAEVTFPKNQWVTIKVHISYDETSGIVQLWQDGQLLVDAAGPTMPLDFWIQNRLEIGITATDNETNLYVDNIKFSDQQF